MSREKRDYDVKAVSSDGGYDMTKKIVMGPYYKYDENSDWFSLSAGLGEVRVIEGMLCHAVQDIEELEEQYDVYSNQNITSRNVYRWVKYDSTQ